MMTGQPSRVTPAEINALLDQLHHLGRHPSLEDKIVYYKRKAELLSRIAAEQDSTEAYLTAAKAWDQLAELLGRTDGAEGGESR